MISQIFHATVYDPLYNGLVFLVGVIPTHDMGVAVVALTIVARVIIYPLSKRAIETQIAMKKIAPDVEKIKEKYKEDKQEQAKAIFALYRERGVHPLASFGLLLVQLPVLIGLYMVFYSGGFPTVDPALLYSFIHMPAGIDMHFFGIISMDSHSIVLAVLTAGTQFVYSRISMGPRVVHTTTDKSFSGDMAKSFELQARYVLPVIMGVVGYSVTAAVPLYLVTSNLFMIGQEYLAGRRWNTDTKAPPIN